MLRISKITDYGIVLLTELARGAGAGPHNARALAETAQLPLPIVSKTLKALTRRGLLVSQRGAKGGFSLARTPERIAVAEVIDALEGPVGLTECSIAAGECRRESICGVREPWQHINDVIVQALRQVTLADLIAGPRGAMDLEFTARVPSVTADAGKAH
ncbi:MAG: SUF system Fe-S cluster assembly regulator [Myxococcales bacterium]|nr:SUF system Fe-S cluster assembly regulator [Myxococcales bacterium]